MFHKGTPPHTGDTHMFKGVKKAVMRAAQDELVEAIVETGEHQVDGIGVFKWDKHSACMSFDPSLELEAQIRRERREADDTPNWV